MWTRRILEEIKKEETEKRRRGGHWLILDVMHFCDLPYDDPEASSAFRCALKSLVEEGKVVKWCPKGDCGFTFYYLSGSPLIGTYKSEDWY